MPTPKEKREVTIYLPSISHIPLAYFWDRGWTVSAGFKVFGVRFIKYTNPHDNTPKQ